MNKDFGIIITTYVGDFFLTKALLASLNHFMPHIPICIIKDGDFDIKKDIKNYNVVSVIEKKDIQNNFLRENCFGSRCTSMISFWESPFENFLFLDADIIAWGDITKGIDYKKFDFIHNTPHEEYTDDIIKVQYFDFELIFNYINKIDYKKHHFFNSGVFFSRKGIFELEKFKILFNLQKQHPSIFGQGPQGIINYMIFENVESGVINAGEHFLQEVLGVFDINSLHKKYFIQSGLNSIQNPVMLHWAGLKPFLNNRHEVFMTPQIYFRKQHLKNIQSIWKYLPFVKFWFEEKQALLDRYYDGKIINYIKNKVNRLIKR
jgi:hypothetical protein